MGKRLFLILYSVFIVGLDGQGQDILPSSRALLDRVDQLQLQHKRDVALKVLDSSINATFPAADMAYFYAYKSSFYASSDSLLAAKQLIDLSLDYAKRSDSDLAMAVAYRASAYLNSRMNDPDAVVSDALTGLDYVENNDEDPITKYHLNYLLYGIYSRWDDAAKMEKYIRNARHYAIKAESNNLLVNVNNGISSMYLSQYRKTHNNSLRDSSYHYLSQSFAIVEKHPKLLSGNTFVITCINLANYYLDHSSESFEERYAKALRYLNLAEEKLKDKKATSDKWINVFGIKSGFAKQRGDLGMAEQLLLQGLSLLQNDDGNHYQLEYVVNKDLTDIALKNGNPTQAVSYQRRAEDLLKKSFNKQQLFNVQKLEMQYDTQKKDQELKILKEREDFRNKQNYLYRGIAVTLLFGLVFMFVSYHFKLKYSIEREKKLTQEKEDAEKQAEIRLKLEKEEQARLKVEQELLDLRRQQLEKEALANSLLIDHKNDMLQQIKSKIKEGDTGKIQKLLKEEMLLNADFEDVKVQIQQLHPDFYNRLNETAIKKPTSLDLKYCTYLFLKMSTKQIAQLLHVEPQSVRMVKYRLKLKFGLGKNDDLISFLERCNEKPEH